MNKRKRPIGYNRERYHNGRMKKRTCNAKCHAYVFKMRNQGKVAEFSWFTWRTSRRSGLQEAGVLKIKGDRHGQRDQQGSHRQPTAR